MNVNLLLMFEFDSDLKKFVSACVALQWAQPNCIVLKLDLLGNALNMRIVGIFLLHTIWICANLANLFSITLGCRVYLVLHPPLLINFKIA